MEITNYCDFFLELGLLLSQQTVATWNDAATTQDGETERTADEAGRIQSRTQIIKRSLPRPQSVSPSPRSLSPLTRLPATAQKIKATLIHKAKVKKSYYKGLAAEGYGGSGPNESELGIRKRKLVKPILGEQRRGPQLDAEEEPDAETPGEDPESELDSDDDEEEVKKGRPSKTKPRNNHIRSQPPSRTPPPAPPTRPKPYDRPAAPPIAAPTKSALKPRLSEVEIEQIRQKKAGERKEWGKKGSRGQPKLGGRVEVLLGRIKRGLGQN